VLANPVLLAPMSGVTDLAFRIVAQRLGAGLVATEMVAGEYLAADHHGARRRAQGVDLKPFVIQLVGCETRWMGDGARTAEALGADIIDINMGCPAREVTGKLSGSALMRDLDHATALIEAVVKAVAVPVTLKMRLGWDDRSHNAAELAQRAERAGVKAVTVHGRTRQQFYKDTANWRAIALVKQAVRIPVIVNGDIVDAASAREALAQSGADAVMIGRGGYGRPWIARELSRVLDDGGDIREPAHDERLAIALDHFADQLRFHGDVHGVKIFRKHLGWYIEGASLPATPEARRAVKSALCRLTDPRDVERALIALWSEQQLSQAA
jgi:nifR3 family TIM-barrel protein